MRLSKFVYGATTLAFTMPTRPWSPGTVGVGAGSEESAAGTPSAWITRREYRLRVPLRFTEAEWPSVRAWLEYAQGGGVFSFYPDASTGTAYACYLVEPKISDPVAPPRSSFPGDMELTVLIRTTTGAAIEPAYF